jgi:plasmid stability protein
VRHLTIRNVPDEVADRLAEERRARGRSLNQTVLELLAQALGVENRALRSNGLAALAGTWSPDEAQEFERAIEFLGELDDDVWR